MARPSRQDIGQWFTPEPVADLALSLARRGARPDASILDPSCGDGVFLRQARQRGVDSGRLCGVDVDLEAIESARRSLPDVALHHCDFFGPEAARLPKFDVVVGNPPYVRQERVGKASKEVIVESVHRALPTLERARIEALVGRSDLAAPFVLRLLGQLRSGGVATLVLSSAFFDSGYGADFWALAEEVASLRLVVDAPTERWFSEAAVHAVIAVFEFGPTAAPISLARLETSTREAAAHIGSGGELEAVCSLRHAKRNEPETWAAALRAPSAWLEFAEDAGDALVPLGELATIRRGVTTGANEIFYLSREQIAQERIAGEFLRPLLTARGRKGQGAIRVEPDELEQFVLVIPRGCHLEQHPNLGRYLERFPDAQDRGTLRNRHPWWSLRTQPAHVFLCKAYGDRFVQPFAGTPMVADQRMYSLEPKDGVAPALLAALLNSTPTSMALEALGRASMGQGALEWTVADAAKLPVLDIRRHADPDWVLQAFDSISRRPIGKLEMECAQSDRGELDEAIASPWPHLVAHLPRLADALVCSSLARHARAKAGLD